MLEMWLAMNLWIKIYLLNPVPKVDRMDEICGTLPIVINNDLHKISL